jgi:NAD(P)-dependent dehydrogenase (short-subunit alcohol dehydrogenase family)
MSKAGIEWMTKSPAVEWARHASGSAVGPGEIPTEGMSKRLIRRRAGARSRARNPMGGPAGGELQNLAGFRWRPGCDWLTGQSIMMDGGTPHPAVISYEPRSVRSRLAGGTRKRIEAERQGHKAQR